MQPELEPRPPAIRVVDRSEAVRALSDEIEQLVRASRACSDRPPVLGLATGATMEPLYAELARRHREGGLSFGRVRAFALDEYCGLPPEHPHRMRRELDRTLLSGIDLPPEQVGLPDVDGGPSGGSLEDRCMAYERAMRAAGGVDLQLLGVGVNGHVAFNEPGTAPDSVTRRVHLAAATREAAAARFGDLQRVPTSAITQGLATIGKARRLRLLAFGPAKAPAIAALARGVADRAWPVTLLLGHPDLEVWADAEAASGA
jgi:glucosamine-6-phosphate deaminase